MLHNKSFGLFLEVCNRFFKKMGNNRRGFTLTEVLITLAVIAVIVVLVLPVVTTRAQNKSFALSYQTEVKQMLNSLEGLPVSENKDDITKTMMYVENDDGKYKDNSGAYINKYMKVTKYCGDEPGDCFAEDYYEYKNNSRQDFNVGAIKGACALLKNGVSICLKPQIKKTNGGRERVTGWIDLNGPKAPNVYGRDLRTFSIDLKYMASFSDEEPGKIVTPDPPEECNDETCPEQDPCEISSLLKECCDKREVKEGDGCCMHYDADDPHYAACKKCDKDAIDNADDPCCQILSAEGVEVEACCTDSNPSDFCCATVNKDSELCCKGEPADDKDPCCSFDSIKQKYNEICEPVCKKEPNSLECCKKQERQDEITGPDDKCCDFDEVANKVDKCCRNQSDNGDTCCKWRADNNKYIDGDSCCSNKNWGLKGNQNVAIDHCCKSDGKDLTEAENQKCCTKKFVKTDYSKLDQYKFCCTFSDYSGQSQCCSNDDGLSQSGDFTTVCCKSDASNPNIKCCKQSDTWNSKCCSKGDDENLKGTSNWQKNCCSLGVDAYPSAAKYTDNCCKADSWGGDCCDKATHDETWGSKCCTESNWSDGCCDAPGVDRSSKQWKKNCCSKGATSYNPKSDFRKYCCNGNSVANGAPAGDKKYCCDPGAPTKECCNYFDANGKKDFDNNALSADSQEKCCIDYQVESYCDSCAMKSRLPNSSQWGLPECCADSIDTLGEHGEWKAACCTTIDDKNKSKCCSGEGKDYSGIDNTTCCTFDPNSTNKTCCQAASGQDDSYIFKCCDKFANDMGDMCCQTAINSNKQDNITKYCTCAAISKYIKDHPETSMSLSTSCCKELNSNKADATWQNQCCGNSGNGLSDEDFTKYCCANAEGGVVGSTTLDKARCCTAFDWGNACCSATMGKNYDGKDEAKCCTFNSEKSAAVSDWKNGNEASDTCCDGTDYSKLPDNSQKSAWQNGCCAKSKYQNDETGHGCCTWKFENGKSDRQKYPSYINETDDPCCTGDDHVTGNPWMNACCSTHYIDSAVGDDAVNCCKNMYSDAAAKEETFDGHGKCCDILEVDSITGKSKKDGKTYPECIDPCSDPMAILQHHNTYSQLYHHIIKPGMKEREANAARAEQAKQCCAEGLFGDDICCTLLASNGDSNWVFSDRNQYPKCCDYRKNNGAWYYNATEWGSPCTRTQYVCSDFKDESKGWYCGDEDACASWKAGGAPPTDPNELLACCNSIAPGTVASLPRYRNACCGLDSYKIAHSETCKSICDSLIFENIESIACVDCSVLNESNPNYKYCAKSFAHEGMGNSLAASIIKYCDEKGMIPYIQYGSNAQDADTESEEVLSCVPDGVKHLSRYSGINNGEYFEQVALLDTYEAGDVFDATIINFDANQCSLTGGTATYHTTFTCPYTYQSSNLKTIFACIDPSLYKFYKD